MNCLLTKTFQLFNHLIHCCLYAMQTDIGFWTLIIAGATLVVTCLFFIYTYCRDKKELNISVIPEKIGNNPFPTHWFLDITACGNRSLTVSSPAKALCSSGEKIDIPLQTANRFLMPGGFHCHSELQSLEIFKVKKIKKIWVFDEDTGKNHRANRKSLNSLKKLAKYK